MGASSSLHDGAHMRERTAAARAANARVRALPTVYYAAVARGRIDAAQQVAREHITSAWTGRCLACDQPGPCDTRIDAEDTLDRYQRLPKRTPGASLGGTEARPLPASSFLWFGTDEADRG